MNAEPEAAVAIENERARAWVEMALGEGFALVLKDLMHQAYDGANPFVAADYNPAKAAAIGGKQQIAEHIRVSLVKAFEKCREPMPGRIRKILYPVLNSIPENHV